MMKGFGKEFSAQTWEEVEQTRRLLDRGLSFREKLEWNAQAIVLADKFQRAKRWTPSRQSV